MIKNKLLIAALAMTMCCATGVGVAEIAKNTDTTMITASAADLGEIKLSTATTTWLADNNKRVLFKLPSNVTGTGFTMHILLIIRCWCGCWLVPSLHQKIF